MAASAGSSVADKASDFVASREEIRKFVRELDTLPSPSFVAAGLLKALMDADPDLRDVQKLVELDQAASMKLLRYANSQYIPHKSPIVSIPQAVSLLGVTQLRGVLGGVAVSETLIMGLRQKSDSDQTDLWRHSLACAICARTLAEQVLPDLTSEAFAIGLLHDVGKLILKECVPEQYQRVEAIHRDTNVPLVEVEEKTLGIDHPTVGKWLAERWSLPLLLVQGVWLHHHSLDVISKLDFESLEHRKLILILRFANDLAHEIMADSEKVRGAPIAWDDAPALLGLELAELQRARASARERCREYTVLFDSRRDELSSYLSALQRTNQKSASLTSKEIQIQTQEKVIQELSRLHDFHAELSCFEDSEDLLEGVARELADGFGKQEGIIYLLRREAKKLLGRQWTEGKVLKGFSLELNEDNSPVRHGIPFLENQMNQLIQTGHTRYRRVAREKQQRLLLQYCKPFLILPLIVENEFSGEIFINSERCEAQQEASLTVYRYLADAAGQALSRIQSMERVRENAEMLNAALSKIGSGVSAIDEPMFRRMAAILRSIPDGVVSTDIDGNIVFCNKAAEALTGWSEAEAVGKPLDTVFTLINPRVDSVFGNPLERLVEKNRSGEYSDDVAIVSRGDVGRLITLNAARAYDRNNNVVGTVIVLRDLAARKTTGEDTARSQKLESLRTLAGGVAHDFNSFLTLMMGNISLARASFESERGNPIERLNTAESACLMAQDLTRQLSVFSNEGRSFKKRNGIAETIKDAVQTGLSGSSIHCRLDLPQDLLPVYCDLSEIHQVIVNLVINAREAESNGETIEVTAKKVLLAANEISNLKEGQYVKISVKDHGMGIPRENISRIFDPYFSTKNTVYRRGTGLGLAVVYSIVRGHEGDIVVESEEGGGSTFHVYLPSAESAVAAVELDTVAQLTEASEDAVMQSERRRHARMKVRWPVTVLTGDQSMVEGETRDISVSGACIRLSNLIEPGQDFRMIIKPIDARFVSVASEIIWSRVNGKGASPDFRGMGVRFLGIREGDRELLSKLISN